MALHDSAESVDPFWVQVSVYAKHWKVGESTVRKWVREGRIRSRRLGLNTIRVDLHSTRDGAA